MINLKCRTEYSFRKAFGKVSDVIACIDEDTLGICDTGTWGHTVFAKACKDAGKRPIFGVEIPFVIDIGFQKKQEVNDMSFLAKNNSGLEEIYGLVSKSAKQNNRLAYEDLFDISDDVIILSGSKPEWGLLPAMKKETLFVEVNPVSFKRDTKFQMVATSDNYFPKEENRQAYELLVGSNKVRRQAPMHLLNKNEIKKLQPWMPYSAFTNTEMIAEQCDASLPVAKMISFPKKKSFKDICLESAKQRNIDLSSEEYNARFEHELEQISNKGFEDYFLVIADMVKYAKTIMLVGPARGSSAGSLICYCLGITEVDPIEHNLLFERFIDVSRDDAPDIDIDFPDDRRELVFDYLREKWGDEKVAHLGTVSRYKARSSIIEVSKGLGIGLNEVSEFKNSIIDRPDGDPRCNNCIEDSFKTLVSGKHLLMRHPDMEIASQFENHARHSGVHAAGIIITEENVSKYCSVTSDSAQIDKRDAEKLNLLKIDALGLRTLSVLNDVLEQIGWSREKLTEFPLDDKQAFDLLNEERYAGIFQFEGGALQGLCKQMHVANFEDMSALTSLARPGPLSSGGAQEYIRRQTGESEVSFLPMTEDILGVTKGIFIYQEQVMLAGREIGKLSWADVSALRKAMSKSIGKSFFDSFYEKFKKGAMENGLQEHEAMTIWQQMNTMGAYAFNRSHAIAYAMVSYWSCVLKSRFPLEFAAACLRNSKDDEQAIALLREIKGKGLNFKKFDSEKSMENWTVQDGELIGGLMNIKGVGMKMAQEIVERRKNNQALSPRQEKFLAEGKTPYDDIFECERRFGHIRKEPEKYRIKSEITDIVNFSEGVKVFFGKLLDKKAGKSNLDLVLADDTGQITASISPSKMIGGIGDWFLVRGSLKEGYRRVFIDKIRKLD